MMERNSRGGRFHKQTYPDFRRENHLETSWETLMLLKTSYLTRSSPAASCLLPVSDMSWFYSAWLQAGGLDGDAECKMTGGS